MEIIPLRKMDDPRKAARRLRMVEAGGARMYVLSEDEAAEVRRIRAEIAAGMAGGRALTDPAIVEASLRLDKLALIAMRRGQPEPPLRGCGR